MGIFQRRACPLDLFHKLTSSKLSDNKRNQSDQKGAKTPPFGSYAVGCLGNVSPWQLRTVSAGHGGWALADASPLSRETSLAARGLRARENRAAPCSRAARRGSLPRHRGYRLQRPRTKQGEGANVRRDGDFSWGNALSH